MNFFSAIMGVFRELVIYNMHDKFGKDTWKLSCPQVNNNGDTNFEVKCIKIGILLKAVPIYLTSFGQ